MLAVRDDHPLVVLFSYHRTRRGPVSENGREQRPSRNRIHQIVEGPSYRSARHAVGHDVDGALSFAVLVAARAVRDGSQRLGDAVDVGRRDVADVQPLALDRLDGDACAVRPSFLETIHEDGASTRRDAGIAPCIV